MSQTGTRSSCSKVIVLRHRRESAGVDGQCWGAENRDVAIADQAKDPASPSWDGYLRHGRRQLTGLGDRVLLAPELAGGFGIAHLIAGRSLVEIKTVLEPAPWLGHWLNQLLGYVLLDWFDTFRLDGAGVYLGWQALLMATSTPEPLTASSPGPTPDLNALRAAFRQAIQG